MSDLYSILNTAHVIGVTLFLGNIIVTGWWKEMADRTREPMVIAFAQRQVSLTDFVFTGGGIALLLAAGIANAFVLDLSVWETPWLAWGVGLFIASGLIWVAVLVPCQIAQARIARAFAAGGPIPPRYWHLRRLWAVFGALATILPLATVYFMVAKPG